MKTVNAGIKSKKELAERLMAGEELYLRGKPLHFDSEYSPPFRIGTWAMRDEWRGFKEVTMEAVWYKEE